MKNVIDYGNIYSEILFHLIINEADEYIEEKNGNEYLTFVSADKKRKVLEKNIFKIRLGFSFVCSMCKKKKIKNNILKKTQLKY